MKQATRVSPAVASSLLVLVLVASALLVVYARASNNLALQAITVLVSMGLVFYASHPLGHLIIAKALGVGTDYFFIGTSDFRKLKMKPMSFVGGLMPTIGTRLNREGLARLRPHERGYVFGAGVIVSNALVGLELAYVLVAGFGILAALLGTLFFVVIVATELMFSTKVGDLGKMAKEFKKPRLPPGGTGRSL